MVCLLAISGQAEESKLGQNLWYWALARGSMSSGDYAPFWFTANEYGLSTPNTKSGLVDIGITTYTPQTFLRNNRDWRIGYGLEVAAPFGMDSHFVLQQAYFELQWKRYLRLSLGQKTREPIHSNLGTGGLTTGTNARPLPEIRLETPRYIYIPGTKNWLGIKAHVSFGWYTDNGWQREFTKGTQMKYTANSRYHSKKLMFQIGNFDNDFPFVANIGLEMACQFGGEAWNLRKGLNDKDGGAIYNEKIASGPKAYWNALIPGGNDSNDGDFGNRAGNHLGSWHGSLHWKGNGTGWMGRLYLEHFFEDQSQMFMQYRWKDMLVGVEVWLPERIFRNYINHVTYEYLGTMDQSGPVYHDATPTLPEQISAIDEYYNNHIYGAWQHAGFVMGNPLLFSPIYNLMGNNEIYCFHNRIKAHHIGLSGEVGDRLSWMFLFTHEKSLGTYPRPLIDPQKGNFLMAEVTYKLRKVNGLAVGLAYGHNDGELLGRSDGARLTVSYSNWVGKNRQKGKCTGNCVYSR